MNGDYKVISLSLLGIATALIGTLASTATVAQGFECTTSENKNSCISGAILPKGGGRQQLGKPYKVAGRWFVPKEEPRYDVSGIASWYGPEFHRRMTANGEWFDMEYLSAAHPTLPLPSYVKVTNLDNGSAIVVRVNDRGPFIGDRIIDVSKKCAEALGFKDRGTASVRVQYVGSAPLDDGGAHLRAVNRELRRGTGLDRMIVAADRAARTVAAVAGTPPHTY